MGIVDYLSREPNEELWPESYLDEKLVVSSIECFHKALDCLSSRLNETAKKIQIDNILEHSGLKRTTNELIDKSSHSCYSNHFVQKRTGLDRNENGPNSRLSKFEQNSLREFSYCKQSVDKSRKQNYSELKWKRSMEEKDLKEKPKKTVKIVERDRSRDQLLERVTETTYKRTRIVHREQDSDNSGDETPQVEWRKKDITNRRKEESQATSTPTST